MVLNIIDTINEWVAPFKSWIEKNYSNPFLWLGFFMLGLLVFSATYSALHRNDD